jgi:hypothetical protein
VIRLGKLFEKNGTLVPPAGAPPKWPTGFIFLFAIDIVLFYLL